MPYPEPSSVAATNVGKGNQRISKPETRVRSALHAMGLRFRKDHAVVISGLRVRPDVVFPRLKVAVFIDGCYWHACPTHFRPPRANVAYWGPKIASNTDRDERVNECLASAGWIVIRAWEHENPIDVAHRIAKVVRDRVACPGEVGHRTEIIPATRRSTTRRSKGDTALRGALPPRFSTDYDEKQRGRSWP